MAPHLANGHLVETVLESGGLNMAENMTNEYLQKISNAFESIRDVTTITHDEYSKFVLNLPGDLACKLRLVPDANLPARMSHLLEIYTIVMSDQAFNGMDNFSVVSIEGSNRCFPFDCDLILYDESKTEVVFIDVTSATSWSVLNEKVEILKGNIKMHNYANARAHVHKFKATRVKVDIRVDFQSNEPGTLGLRVTDMICRQERPMIDRVMKQMELVYTSTIDEMSKLDMLDAPGDYKDYDFDEAHIQSAIRLVKTHSDIESAEFLNVMHEVNPTKFPYSDALMTLASRSQKFKKLVPIEAAEVFESRDLQSNLAALEDNWLCRLLHAATLTENVVAMDDAGEITFLSDFPCNPKDKALPTLLKYKACIKQRKNHIFKILFNPAHADQKLRRIIADETMHKDKRAYKREFKSASDATRTFVRDAVADYAEDFQTFTSVGLSSPKDSVWRKIQTISALASNDLDNLGRSTCTMLDSFLSMIESMFLGDCLAHSYEVYKTILASLKVSPSDNDYYVGINGSYKSVSLVKMSSTLDSFSKTNFSVIFKPERKVTKRRTRWNGTVENGIYSTHFYSIDPNQLSYGLRLPMVIASFATWEIENNLENGSIQNGMAPQIIFDSAMHSLVGRDQFAQASEQIRYFYMSAIGYGGSAEDIASKTTFMIVRHSWEALYLMRSFKVAACLNIISASRRLPDIEDPKTKELAVAFPHTLFPSKSFSQTVSSMYVCNIYNKFRAFHEVSDAICYNDILDELDIYNSRVAEDENAVSGLSPNLISAFSVSEVTCLDYILSESFIADEVDFNLSLAKIKSSRYCGSMTFMMGSSVYNSTTPSSTIDSIYHKLSQCPIEACTMRGSMNTGPSTAENQGLRAASAILEEIIRSYNMEPASVNKSILGAANLFDRMSVDSKSFSVFMFVLMQFCLIVDEYRYRTIDKDQKGHREISVLNFLFRIGALFVEIVSRELSSCFSDTDLVHNPNKDKIVEDAIKAAFKESRSKPGAYCFDNSDQKRWGPNHNMNYFAFFLFPMLRTEPGLMRLMIKVFDKTFNKRAKFPEPLIKLIMVKKMRTSGSEPIQKFIDRCAAKMDNKIFETKMSQGMCQGIYHDTSSLIHAGKAKSSIHLAMSVDNSLTMKYMVTSDDAEGIIHIAGGRDLVESTKIVHTSGLRVGNLFNIVRSNPKSAFNFHIAELNSNFYKRGNMATPSIKQRISKIDVGFGVNHIEDYLTVLSSAANYLASGGSYMGAYIMSILNLTLHTEQWLRWDFAKSDNYYKPVEMGGFPVIEPISTILSGGVSNLFLRSTHMLSPDNYARLITNTLLCPPERIALSDFSRSGSETAKASFKTDDLTVFKGTGPFGLFQTVRTDRKLSVFERRHGISKWIIPEAFANLNRTSSKASDFLFTIFRNTSVNTLETNLGVNSFYVRYAEPWVSYDRKCFIVSQNSPFAPSLGGPGARVSHRDMKDSFMAKDLARASSELQLAFRRCTFHAEFEVLETQLAVRLKDALSLFTFLREQEAESFRSSVISPSIQTVTLRGQSASDSDAYFLAIVKSMAGESSRSLINNYRRSSKAYDEIMISPPRTPASLLDTIVFADNAVSIYNKFIRRDTKMVIPNNVDDMRQLCIDIMRNKFTERMGIVTTGRLDMSEERSKPYAYTRWYQELLKISEAREANLAARALSGNSELFRLANISTQRGLLTSRDMFEISTNFEPTRTVLLSATNKSAFVRTIKNWMGAKVKFTMDRDTISHLVRGRLTFGHDYYTSGKTFMRHPKSQYMIASARASVGTHFITTTIKKVNNRTVTLYDHTFVFKDNVNGSNITFEKSPGNEGNIWIDDIITTVKANGRVVLNKWMPIKSSNTNAALNYSYRRSISEEDRVRFVSISPSTEFEIKSIDTSLTLFLSSANLDIAVSYSMPTEVKGMKNSYTLANEDFKLATKVYSRIKKETSDFSKSAIRANYNMIKFLDFVLVESTIATEQYIIDREMTSMGFRHLTPIQLDILRTMLVNNRDIGVNFSSHRFTSSLLNMGYRRRHNHTFFTRRIMGERVDYESEEISEFSDTEEVLNLGVHDERLVLNDDQDDMTVIPDYLKPVGNPSLHDDDYASIDASSEAGPEPPLADLLASEEAPYYDTDLIIDTASDGNLFSDDDWETDGNADAESESKVDEETNSPIPLVQMMSSEIDVSEAAAANAISQLFSGIMDDMSFDAIFNPEEETTTIEDGFNAIDTIDNLFSRALNDTYGKIKDDKDTALKSIVTGHTVDGNLETARPIIRYLKDWLETAGQMKEFDFMSVTSTNISKLTQVYIMFESFGMLDNVNPILQMTGSNDLMLPVELSALTVIDAMYM
nr:MAG: RNA-dependent RNA polymerase [Cladosporium cladosporioides negative-stranded RNA virus 2]